MASPQTPTHGKQGALYRLRPGGFRGAGLNDITWGGTITLAASAVFEVAIDAEGSPDTFKWRKDGGAWTTGVSITGSAQTLSDGVEVTFAATTGHTLADAWIWGKLVDEACDESLNMAQVTDADKRILNPNRAVIFADSGGKTVVAIDYAAGRATFDGNVGTVTVTGEYVPLGALEKVGYVFGWSLDLGLDVADASFMGSDWKSSVIGQGAPKGKIDAYFIGAKSMLDTLTSQAAGGEDRVYFLQLFNYDPDQDQTGDHFQLWASFDSIAWDGTLGTVVKESVSFTGFGGAPYFVSNT